MSHQSLNLKPLPYLVFFVIRDRKKWGDVMNGDRLPDVVDVIDRFRSGSDSWLINPYIHLKKQGLDVHLTDRFIPGQICVTAYEELGIRDFPFNSFVVTCRINRARPEICEHRIVQNKLNIVDETDHYLPHWPQPGLMPRDSSRGSRIENIVYLGRDINLAPPFRDAKFAEAVKDLGLNFEVRSPNVNETGYKLWSDYRDVDVVFAVRDLTEYDFSLKPPSKLINTWLAGSVAILGAEPAYQQLRHSELDYIEIKTIDEALSAIRRLRDRPELYQAMLHHSQERAQEFHPDQITKLWRDLLAGEIAQGYERWRQQNPIFKLLGRPIQFLSRVQKHKQEKQYFKVNILQGRRPFSEAIAAEATQSSIGVG